MIEETPEKHFNGDEELINGHKELAKKGVIRENIRTLYVRIQFLRPCKAKTLFDLSVEATSQYERTKYDDIMTYIVVVGIIAKSSDSNKREQIENLKNTLTKLYPDAQEIIDDGYMWPKYNCDYRNNVFVTYYDSLGIEIKTEKKLPIAGGPDGGKRKYEMLPGEETYLTFTGVPDCAVSWKVWVPK